MTTLQKFKRADQLDLDLAIAEAEALITTGAATAVRPEARRLTKADAVSPELVSLYPGEHIEPKRW